jgi:hypothetical protein
MKIIHRLPGRAGSQPTPTMLCVRQGGRRESRVREAPDMTISAEHARRRQHMVVFILGLAAVRILVRHKSVLTLGLAAVAGAASRRAAADVAAWREPRAPGG